MTTIASLNIGTGIDTAGIGRGLSVVEQQLSRFGSQINGKATGSDIAEDVISGLQQRLEQAQATLQDSLVSGLADPAGLAAAAESASAEYMTGLKRGLGRLAAQGLVTDEVRQQFEVAAGALAGSTEKAFETTFAAVSSHLDTLMRGASFSSTQAESIAGLQQAETALQASLKTTTLTFEQRIRVEEELARVEATLSRNTRETAAAIERTALASQEAAASAGLMGRFINRSTGDFTALGRRASGALVGISFALDGIVQGGGKAIDSVHGILRTVATVAPAFGAEGLLVSAVAAGTDAIIGIFDKTRDEMDRTQQDFEEKLRQMQNAGDTIGQESELQKLQFGEPGAGLSQFSPTEGPLQFNTGGLLDLRADLAKTQGELSAGTFENAKQVRDLQAHAAELLATLKPLEAQEKSLTRAINEGTTALRTPTGLNEVTVTAGEASKSVDELTASLARGMAALTAFGAAGPTIHLSGVVDAIKTPKDLPDVKVRIAPQFEHLDELTQHLAALTSAREAVQSAGLDDETTRRTAEEAQGVLALTTAWRGYVATLLAGGASADELAEAAKRFRKQLQDAGINADDIGKGLTSSGHGLDDAAQAAHRLGQAFGGVGDDIGDVLGGISDVQDALTSLKAPDLSFGDSLAGAASIIGAIGAVGGILGSLGQPSPTQVEHDRILTENNQQLAELKLSLDRFGETAGSIGNTRESLAQILANPREPGLERLASNPIDLISDPAMRQLAAIADAAGTSLAQLNKVAKDNGIALLDDQGHLVAGAFDQLATVLRVTTDILTMWGQSFGDQMQLLQLRDRALGVERTPAVQASEAIGELLKQAGPNIDSAFKDFDTSTKAGRDQVRASIAGFLDRIFDQDPTNDLTLADLSGFKDVQELGQAFGVVLDGLDGFDGALGKVTDSLLNVPEIFKLARVRFESALPDAPGGGTLSQGPPQVPTTVKPEPGVVIPPPVIPATFMDTMESVLQTLGAGQESGIRAVGGTMENVLDRLGAGQETGIRAMGDTITAALGGGLDVSIGDSQFDALLEALRAASPGADSQGGGDTFNGDIYVDARTKSVQQAWDETLTLLRQQTRSGGIPLAGVRVT